MSTPNPAPSLPPGAVLYQMAIGHYLSRALYVAAKLGVADLLAAGPRDARALATDTETDESALARLLRFLASVGVFEVKDDGRFAITPLGDALRDDVPGSSRASVMLFSGISIQDGWKELEYCVRTGQPAFRQALARRRSVHADGEGSGGGGALRQGHGRPSRRRPPPRSRPPTTSRRFAHDRRRRRRQRLAADRHPAGEPGSARHRLRPAARRASARAGRSPTPDSPIAASAVGGSFFDEVPRGADAYLLKHVIHDWNDEHAAAILRNVPRARCRRTASC